MADRALDDLRVLDISESASGAWCSRMLADFGAKVLMVEGPAGHPLRGEAPFDGDGRSIAGELFLANKQSIVLDLSSAAGREAALALGRRCDIVVSSHSPSRLEALGLTYQAFDRPSLVMTHITPYGGGGPTNGRRRWICPESLQREF